MRRYFFILLFLLLIGCAPLNILPPSPEQIIDLKTGKKIFFRTLIENIKDSRVVIIGEKHNEKSHHDAQLRIIKELNRKNSIAVGMEMFQNSSNKYLKKWSQKILGEKGMKSLFAKEWSKAYYPFYSDILRFTQDFRIPLIGLNIPRKLTHKIASKGLDSLSEEEQKSLLLVTCDLTEDYRGYLKRAYELKSHKKGSFENFCMAQVFWDSSMAYHAVEFLKNNPGRQLIILAGSTHAQRLGIPARMQVRMNIDVKVIIPQSDKDEGDREITYTEADYLWIPAGNGRSSF